jgi:serine protease Do
MDVFAPFRNRVSRLGLLAPMVLLLAVGATAVSPQAAAAPAVDAQALLQQVAPAVAVVRGALGPRRVSGTAFVIDPQGWLLTASHVVRSAQRVQVALPGLAPLEAQVVGYDATRDLAVLRVNAPSPLPSLPLADGMPRVGETVYVVGAPQGRPGVVTTGEVVVAGTSMPGLVRDIFIQISAQVRPGESGGPVLNSRGQVVGVVVAASFDESNGRGGLAVSQDTIRGALPQLRQGAKVDRAWIGIAGPDRPPTTDQGATIREVLPASPAASAGLRPGDTVVDVAGTAVHTWVDLLTAVGQHQPGQTVRLVVLREGSRVEVTLTLGVRP